MFGRKDKPDPQRPMGRRGFFKKFLHDTMDTAEEVGKQAVQRFTDQVEAISSMAETPAEIYPGPMDYEPPLRYVRPPGSSDDYTFTNQCHQCGLCVESCPADAIKMDEDKAEGFPYIEPREQPCVVCDDLSCMKVCPSGALKLVDHIDQITMGTAWVDQHTCVRSQWNYSGEIEACNECMDVCPLEEKAIGLDDHEMIEIRDGCIGCGLCEKACPTDPTSIWVEINVDHHDPHWDHPPIDFDRKRKKLVRLMRMNRTSGILNRRVLKKKPGKRVKLKKK